MEAWIQRSFSTNQGEIEFLNGQPSGNGNCANVDNTNDVSILIVSYNVKHFLEQCLKSVLASSSKLKTEIIVVDNNSTDNSVEFLSPRFPTVKFISNDRNVGFGTANNQASKFATGKYLLILNPDTILSDDSLIEMVRYLEAHKEVGAITPMILNRQGDFEKASKRGLPTPWVSFCKISGLSRLFPKSKFFGKYDLLYLDPEKPAKVDALTGCCMMVQRSIFEKIEGFDEDYFLYGEDIDISYRISKEGWENHYAPVTRIVHYRGESLKRSKLNRDKVFYSAMHLFVAKHFKDQYFWFSRKLINLGIIIAWGLSRLKALIGKTTVPVIDLVGIWCLLVLARLIRTLPFWTNFGLNPWGEFGLSWEVSTGLWIQSLTWIIALSWIGVYSFRKGQNRFLWLGILVGFLLNSSLCYFFQQFAYSRFAILFASISGLVYILTWRYILRKISQNKNWRNFLKRSTLIVGNQVTGEKVWEIIREDSSSPYNVLGLLSDEVHPGKFPTNDVPILGSENDLERTINNAKIEEIIFAYDQIDYNHILEVVSGISQYHGIHFKLVTPESVVKNAKEIPFLTMDYLVPRGIWRSVKRIVSLIIWRGRIPLK